MIHFVRRKEHLVKRAIEEEEWYKEVEWRNLAELSEMLYKEECKEEERREMEEEFRRIESFDENFEDRYYRALHDEDYFEECFLDCDGDCYNCVIGYSCPNSR